LTTADALIVVGVYSYTSKALALQQPLCYLARAVNLFVTAALKEQLSHVESIQERVISQSTVSMSQPL